MKNYRNKDMRKWVIRLWIAVGLLALITVQAIIGRLDAEAELSALEAHVHHYQNPSRSDLSGRQVAIPSVRREGVL